MEALKRAMVAVPSDTIETFRGRRGCVALRVVSEHCPACVSHKQERASSYEEGLGCVVIEVSIDDKWVRRLVVKAGVEKIPAYILLAPGSGEEIRYPNETP